MSYDSFVLELPNYTEPTNSLSSCVSQFEFGSNRYLKQKNFLEIYRKINIVFVYRLEGRKAGTKNKKKKKQLKDS